MKHVILGNGPAGVIAAETLRKNAPADDIVLVGEEREPPYSRMSIPQLLKGEIRETDTYLRRDKEHFSRLQIRQKFGRAVHVSTRTRTVKMEDGCEVPFDKLLIATGSIPRIPFIPGIDLPSVHACWTLEDARRIMLLAAPSSRVVLIGAGFIGCQVMEALASRGVRLTVIERRDRVMPNVMSKSAGEMIARWCARKGVRVITGTRVVGIGSVGMQDVGSPRIVRLSGGEQVMADLVVHCAGAIPNISFLKGSGIKCMQGVVVDASMQTNVPGVYAAGDCAEAFDSASGRAVITGVQPNAADQAYCAALNMSDKRATQYGVRQIDVFNTLGLVSSSIGQWQGVRGGQWVEFADDQNFRYLRLEFSRDILIGSNAVGITEYAGILRSLIRNQVRLGEWKDKLLRDPTLLREAYAGCVQQRWMERASVFHTPHTLPVESGSPVGARQPTAPELPDLYL